MPLCVRVSLEPFHVFSHGSGCSPRGKFLLYSLSRIILFHPQGRHSTVHKEHTHAGPNHSLPSRRPVQYRTTKNTWQLPHAHQPRPVYFKRAKKQSTTKFKRTALTREGTPIQQARPRAKTDNAAEMGQQTLNIEMFVGKKQGAERSWFENISCEI